MAGRRMQHTKWKATNGGAVRRHRSSGVFLRGKCTIYDFPVAFEYQACASPFLRVPPVYFRGLISPQSPDNRSAATTEVEGAHGESWLALKYLWFFSVVIAWVLTAVAHSTPPKTKGLMCCCLLWFGEVRQSACFSTVHRLSKPQIPPWA